MRYCIGSLRDNQGRIKRGAQGALAPGPPFPKGPPATQKKTIITIFNNANVIKVRLIILDELYRLI